MELKEGGVVSYSPVLILSYMLFVFKTATSRKNEKDDVGCIRFVKKK